MPILRSFSPGNLVSYLSGANVPNPLKTVALQDKGGQVYNVKAFGAKGDGVTDDTAAIQTAITAAWSVGGTVAVPAGEFCYTTLTLPTGDGDSTTRSLSIIGATANEVYGDYTAVRYGFGSRLRCTKTDGTPSLVANSTAGSQHPTYAFQDLTIIGPDTLATASPVGGTCLKVSGQSVANVFLNRVHISGFRASGAVGLWLDNCENGSVRDVMVLGCDVGIRLTNNVNAYSWSNVTAQLCDTLGMDVQSAWSISWSGGCFQSNKKSGLNLTGALGWVLESTHFENNNSGNTGGEGAVKLIGQAGVSNQHIHFNRCKFSGASGNDRIIMAGNATGKNHRIVFDGGYNAVSGTFVTVDANSQYTEFNEFCPATLIADAGSNTEIKYHGVRTIGGFRTPALHAPSDHNYLSWSGDPQMFNGTTAPVAGTVWLSRQDVLAPGIVNAVDLCVTTAGSTLTAGQNLIALYDSTGALLWTSADQSSVWTSTGIKRVSTGGIAVSSPFVWVAILANGTTPPTFARLSSATTGLANAGLTTATSRCATLTATGQTTMPASFTPSTGLSQQPLLFWVGVA